MGSNLSPWPFHDSIINDTNPVAKTDTNDRQLIERVLNHKHMIETIERFEWKGLPPEIPSDLIERVLYFRFKGALFQNQLGRFIFLPFTLRGEGSDTIDSYGRYTNIVPVLFTGQWKISGDGEMSDDIAYMSDLSYNVIYDMPEEEIEGPEGEEGPQGDPNGNELQTKKTFETQQNNDKAVILTDSSLEISQDYTPMAYLCRPFNEQLTDILVLVNMDLITSAKAFYIVAKDADQKEAIESELAGMDRRILNGRRYVVVTSPMQLQELVGTSAKDTARYFQSYQSIDNIRKDIIGGDNGGTFLKQEHTTEAETETNSNQSSGASPIMNNALRMRKEFCKIANKVFGLSIDVELKQAKQDQMVEPKGSQTIDREDGGEE